MIGSDYKHIDLSYMDLMADGDADMKKTMLEMLLEELPSEVNKMQVLHQSSDWTTLKAVSHKLKSTLAFVGNETLTESNKSIERIAKDEEGFEELPTLLQTISQQSELAIIELRSEFSKL